MFRLLAAHGAAERPLIPSISASVSVNGAVPELLALRFDAKRTRQRSYRAMRVLHEHFHCDPATLEETHLRDYLLHIKLHKHWKPKTIRQTLACAKLFFVELLERPLWRVFSQIRTRGFLPIPAKRYSWYPS